MAAPTYAELAKEDPKRQTAMTASFLRASLFTSVVAFGIAAMAAFLGVIFILTGWALGFRSTPHAYYAVAIAVAFHVRVLVAEEPFLARTHGEEWRTYKSRVPRWLLPLAGRTQKI